MEEFAAFAGLSRQTVSKYFNDPGSVRRTTRSRIETAVQVSGFQPNLHAMNLNRRQSQLLGVVVPHTLDPFYMSITRRIEQVATEHGYIAFTLSSDGRPDLELRAIRTFASMNVAGTIIAPLGARRRRSPLRKAKLDMPIVAMDSPLDDATAFVGTDNRSSVALMIDYLCRSGEPPAWFDIPTINQTAIERRIAYEHTMRRLGHEPRWLMMEACDHWDFERYAHTEARRLLSTGELTSRTILCANDRLGFGVLSAAWSAGLRVGRDALCDLRVAGHDNHPLSAYTCPPLTTVAQDHVRIAETAAELLFARIEERQPRSCASNKRVLLDGTLIMRESA